MDSYLVHDGRKSGGAMHALVVGVGDYPHLLGGSGDLTDSHDGMRQLSSPPVSARAVADWLIRDFNNPNYPQRTVSLLLSEASPAPYVNPVTGESHDVERADFAKIHDAVRAWKERGDHDVEDMLVFYFCGHGICEGNAMVVLPSDFGADPDNAYDTAIDFVRLYDAMAQYKARYQCFFVDACRSSSDTLGDNIARSLLQARPREADGVCIAPVYYSSLKGEAAHGRIDRVSLFTEALLKSLSDFAAIDDEGDDDWRVDNFNLSRALDHMMKREQERGTDLVQVPDSTEIRHQFYLHYLKAPPRANLYVSSEPEDRLAAVRLICTDGAGFQESRDPTPEEEWAITVPTGDLDVEAILDAAGAAKVTRHVRARPLFKRVRLELP